ncbi:hypothetical protein [Pyrobaculum aerophilum]|uniref:hypothetical protein n=1 Tax=Pyrobaculum aerophilum TaxID=13773 RepID=UPI00216181CC|nr:hypothetical protein [Pyrobaculum aerophilum]
MATFDTPCVVALGVVKNKVFYLEVESGKKAEEYIGVEIDSAEPGISGEFITGHLAIASFSTTIVKGVALAKPVYVLDLEGLKPLAKRAVTLRHVKAREFGAWEPVWNKPLYLTDASPSVAVGVSRAGSLLHINAVPSDIELAKKYGQRLKFYKEAASLISTALAGLA